MDWLCFIYKLLFPDWVIEHKMRNVAFGIEPYIRFSISCCASLTAR